MPTYTAIAFDRFLETGASKPIDKPAPTSMPVPKVQKLERTTSAPPVKNKVPRPRLKPALYTTPEVKQLPVVDSPSSFPPSPYIINHKRRGPRLHKSSSEASVLSKKNVSSDEKVDDKSFDTCAASSAGDLQFSFTNPEPVEKELLNGVCGGEFDRSNGSELMNGHKEPENSSFANGLIRENGPALNTARDTDIEDFFDPQDSMSFTSNTDVEENAGTDLSMKFSSPGGEFYDAWEELSSDAATQNSASDVEAELREMRLSLLMEIEKRKQAEESLNNMRNQWQSIRQGLYLAGIILPADLTAVAEGEQLNSDPVEDLCQQLYVARFISNTIGRATVRTEVEMEMEAQLESKNFEIARLMERLHCYETMNHEMSQRNQEAVEMARRERQRKSKKQKWIWGSLTTVIALGTAAVAWSYLPAGGESYSAEDHPVPKHDDAAK
ncbi:hypothetical protein MtrunA17_Chr5g0404591 [Medicago truncatula]|uniref:Plant/F18B3-190 protein, putative n=1 Tax=Medicago truncatula TaxID=3880 RepID=G7KF01_MEDTR|nr:uncharacterized protein LOC11410095 [Medicago truncatula]XP_039690243.1 uncharacterized protein LOC11410095 [Medicago truncatula]AES95021.1 plant/F18B3-190 protein, putative [Medicago truncatula]AFK36820.1 unknown [Medicago truncatula]RHN54243.1 hypothetical protein MtrunA17_Chr5g0404591 [Medicago truncatula]